MRLLDDPPSGATAIDTRPPALARRRPLPGGRALVGGFLVAASAVGLFASYAAATARSLPTYVVADRDVAAGQRVGAGDLKVVAIDLPPEQRARAFTDPGVLAGAVAVAPIAEGDVVQATAVAARPAYEGRAELSFPIASSRALGGRLDTGEWVDVIATYGAGEQATVRTVAYDAVVVRAEPGDAVIGGSGGVTLVLALLPDELEAVAHAAAAAEVSIARTTGLAAS